MQTIKVGLLGFGTVGSGVYQNLRAHAGLISQRLGARIAVTAIADRSVSRKKDKIASGLRMTEDTMAIVRDPAIDIVVELIGGETDARRIILAALRAGKHVVTANKALLAMHGKEIFAVAHETGRSLYYEAAVGGGIPIIKALREGLGSNKIHAIEGIVNGTANFVLSKMSQNGADFGKALGEAQKQGFAEADPTFDVQGVDSAHKLVILATLASGSWVPYEDVHVEGIAHLDFNDIAFARGFGYVIKLLSIYKDDGKQLELRVHPTLLPKGHLLASVGGAYNAIYVSGDPVGRTLYYGQGAGGNPTSSAVISDLMDISRNMLTGAKDRMPAGLYLGKKRKIKSMADVHSRAYLKVHAKDRPGVLARVSGILGQHGVSIASVLQEEGTKKGAAVPVALLTHKARGKDLADAIKKIDALPSVQGKTTTIRIEEEV